MASYCRRALSRTGGMAQCCVRSRLLSTASAAKPERAVRPKIPSASKAILEARAEALKVQEAKAAETKLPWKIVAASLIERHPIIMRDPESWEADFWAVQEELLRHGRALPEDSGLMGSEKIYDKTEEQVVKELPFKLAPRITKADRMQDRTTLNRALAERLFLLVRLKGQQEWNLPLQAWDGKKAMREVHEGLLLSTMGDKFEAYIPSNAPVGFQWFAYPADRQQKEKAYGEKVFYYRSQHMRGRGVPVASGVEEFVWVSKDEVPLYIKDQDYATFLRYIM